MSDLIFQGDADHLGELVKLWSRSSRSGSPHTVRARLGDLRAWARWLGLTSKPPMLERDGARALFFAQGGPVGAASMVHDWIQDQRASGYAQRTIARRVWSLRSLVRVAHEHGLPWLLPARGPAVGLDSGVEGPPAERVKEVLARLKSQNGVAAARDHAILALLYCCGCRRSEVVALDVGDVDLPGCAIRTQAKNRGTLRRQVAVYVRDAIADWLRWRGRTPGPLFCGIHTLGAPVRLCGDRVRRITHDLGLGSPHRLRHTGATVLARAGRLDLAQAHLGHRSLATTGAYVDREADDRGLASRLLAGEGTP